MIFVVWEQTVSSDWTFRRTFKSIVEAHEYIQKELAGRLKNDGYCICAFLESNFPDWFGAGPLTPPEEGK